MDGQGGPGTDDDGAGAGVVGPVPAGADPDAYDRLRRRVLWAMPSGLYVVGSRADAGEGPRWNLMTANLVMQVSTDPKRVAVAVDAGAVTAALISAGRAFSVSLLDRDDRAVVRRFVKPVGDVETAPDGRATLMAGQPVSEAPSGSPVLASAAAWIDCTLDHRLELGSHVLFVGLVSAVGGDPEGRQLLRMEDTRMNYGG
jgi:flavin reductase (DIM6/NTAB) family NADH-FMN oxidoreductase RutF